MRKAALPRRPLAFLAAAALHVLLAVLIVSRVTPQPAEPPILKVTLVDLPPRRPKSQPAPPSSAPAPARAQVASTSVEQPPKARQGLAPDWRVDASEPAEGEATRATLRARLGCRTADLLALTKAERAACHEALAKGAETAPTYAVVSPKLRKVFDGTFECPKGNVWCEYRVGEAPYPGLFAPRNKPRDPTWDQ